MGDMLTLDPRFRVILSFTLVVRILSISTKYRRSAFGIARIIPRRNGVSTAFVSNTALVRIRLFQIQSRTGNRCDTHF